MRDITDQRRAEEYRQTVIGELHHRVKNVLANVSAIARQTAQRSATIDDYTTAFQGRLAALSRVHDMITGDHHEAASLLEIVCAELDAHGAVEGRDFRIDGPELHLEPRQAQAMILAVHELVTNAAKYGALHQTAGRIEVDWTTTESDGETWVSLSWRERGVQLEGTPPARGFGRSMIEDSLPRMLEGTVDLRFHADGVECRIEFPLRRRQAAPAS